MPSGPTPSGPALSGLSRRALLLRRRHAGRRGLVWFTAVSVLASWLLCNLVYLAFDPGMVTSLLGQLLPVLAPALLAGPAFWVLLTLVDDLGAEVARREDTEAVLRRHAGQDDLTGLANRRTLMAALAAGLRDGSVEAVAMFDLDHFKRVNDEFGHAAGDRALVAVATAASEAVGARGMVSRLGGEEFAVVVLRGGGVLEELLAQVLDVVRAAGDEVGTTISIGATVVRPGDTVDSALLRADGLLYQAKARGRDRVVLDPQAEDASEPA